MDLIPHRTNEFNVLIEHPNFSSRDRTLIFGDEPAVVLSRTATMIEVLTAAGIFSSKSQARKNWQGEIEIPEGCSIFTVGKLRKRIFIHKPPENLPPDIADGN